MIALQYLGTVFFSHLKICERFGEHTKTVMLKKIKRLQFDMSSPTPRVSEAHHMVLELHNSMRGIFYPVRYSCSESLTRMSVEDLGDVQQSQTIDGKGLQTCNSHLVACCMQNDPGSVRIIHISQRRRFTQWNQRGRHSCSRWKAVA